MAKIVRTVCTECGGTVVPKSRGGYQHLADKGTFAPFFGKPIVEIVAERKSGCSVDSGQIQIRMELVKEGV